MSYKPTLIALALAIIGVVAALYVHRADPASAARARTNAATPLVTDAQLPTDSVNRITLARGGEPAMVFERSGPHWMQIEPFRYPMDRYSMRQLSAIAHQVQVVERLSPRDLQGGLSEAGLGLDPPEAEITYEWDGGSLALQFGRRGIAGRAYMRMGGEDDVLIARQELHERVVEMEPKEWRDRTIFQHVGVESDRIVRRYGGTRLVLERERRQWKMLEPVATRVDGEALEAFIQSIGGARSGGFIADLPRDLNRFGLQPSGAEFTVTGRSGGENGDSREQTLRIGMPVGAGTQDRYGIVDGRPTVIRVPAAVLQAFFRQPRTLIDPTGSGVVAADVRTVRITTDSGELTLERDMERWRAPKHGNARVPDGYVDQLLSQLTELRAGDVQIQQYPQELEVAMVSMFGFRGQPLGTVRIVHEPAGNAWALESGDNVLRVFSGEAFQPRLTAADFGLTPLIDE